MDYHRHFRPGEEPELKHGHGNEHRMGNSLAVQWLGLGAFTARAQVQSLVGELRSRKPRGVAIKQQQQQQRKHRMYVKEVEQPA